MTQKILLITGRSDSGGGPKHLLDLLASLKEDPSFDAYIASPLDAPFYKAFKEQAKEHLYIPSRKFSFKHFFKLKRFVRDHQINIVHSHGRAAGLYSRALSIFGVKVIHTFHGVHVKKTISEFFKNTIERLLTRLTQKLIFVSQEEMNNAQTLHYPIDNGVVISNGIPINQTNELTQNLKGKKCLKMGTLTRLEEHKGNKVLIDHFNDLYQVEKNHQISLHLAGEGPDQMKLMAYSQTLSCRDAIIFHGLVQNPDQFLEDIDIFVSASKSEGMPYAVLEAMNHRRPCLLSDVPGHRHIAPQVILFKQDNANDFAAKFQETIERGQEKAQENFLFLKENYDINQRLQDIKEVYLGLSN